MVQKSGIKYIYVISTIIISVLASILVNRFVIDELLDTFVIMSPFSLVCNRIAIGLLIYFMIDLVIDFFTKNSKYTLNVIANYLMLIYSITLIGLLYGRHLPDDLTYSYVSSKIGNYVFVGTLVLTAIMLILYFIFKKTERTFCSKLISIINQILIIGVVNLISLILSTQTPPNAINSFNFDSIILKWLNFLHLKLVVYYLLGNILVTIPLGIYIGFKKTLIDGIVTSLLVIHLVEFIQAITNLGYYDIDDLILNGIGAMFGVILINVFLQPKKEHNT